MYQNKQTNIIIINAHHRYDLSATLCVNNEVLNFNWKLRKRMKIYDHMSIIDPGQIRDHITINGLHMNHKGKETAEKKNLKILKTVLTMKVTA